MFSQCDSLMFIDLSNFYLKEQIEYLFMSYNTTNFKHGNYFNVQYMNLNNSSVEKIGIYSLMNFALEVNQSSTVYFCLNEDISLYNDLSKEQMEIKDHIKKCCD